MLSEDGLLASIRAVGLGVLGDLVDLVDLPLVGRDGDGDCDSVPMIGGNGPLGEAGKKPCFERNFRTDGDCWVCWLVGMGLRARFLCAHLGPLTIACRIVRV